VYCRDGGASRFYGKASSPIDHALITRLLLQRRRTTWSLITISGRRSVFNEINSVGPEVVVQRSLGRDTIVGDSGRGGEGRTGDDHGVCIIEKRPSCGHDPTFVISSFVTK